MLVTLQATTPHPFTVVDTTGTLRPSHWQDEIHPSTKDFGRIAQRIGRAAVRHFPNALARDTLRNYRRSQSSAPWRKSMPSERSFR